MGFGVGQRETNTTAIGMELTVLVRDATVEISCFKTRTGSIEFIGLISVIV